MIYFAMLLLAADAPKFEAVTTQSPHAGQLSALGAGWSANVGGQAIAAGSLVELRQTGIARPAAPVDRPHVRLANGDIWPAQLVSLIDDKLKLSVDFGSNQEISLSVSAVSSILLKPPKSMPPDGKRSSDEIYLGNGDVVRGTVTRIAKGDVAVEAGGKQSAIPVDRVAVIAFSTDLLRSPKPRGPVARVTLANGARITLAEANLQDGRLMGKTLTGPAARLLLADVVHIAILGGPATYLSDLGPLSFEHTPYLNTSWPLAKDRNTAGGPLRIGADTFDRGLGMHSKSRAVFAIPANSGRFEAIVGLDAVAGVRGRVRVAVAIDGKDTFGPAELAGGQAGQKVDVALPAEAKEVALIVEFGAGADVQDHVDWGDARFVSRR